MIRFVSNINEPQRNSAENNSRLPLPLRSALVNRSSFQEEGKIISPKNQLNKIVFTYISGSTCQLCEMSKSLEQMKSLSDCAHNFCIDCLHEYVIYKIKVMEEVHCPKEGCDRLMTQTCESYLSLPDQYKLKYQRIKVFKETAKNPNLRVCPSELCTEGVLDMSAAVLRCNRCGSQYCKECMLMRHDGPCDTNFQNNFKDWKRCPHCKMFIEKIEGCNHMTCTCSHQFCYVCLKDWDEEHYQCGAGLQFRRNQVLYFECFHELNRCQSILVGILSILVFPIFLALLLVGVVIGFGLGLIAGVLCGPIGLIAACFSRDCSCCVCKLIGAIIMIPFMLIGGVLTYLLYYVPVGLFVCISVYCKTSAFLLGQNGRQENDVPLNGEMLLEEF